MSCFSGRLLDAYLWSRSGSRFVFISALEVQGTPDTLRVLSLMRVKEMHWHTEHKAERRAPQPLFDLASEAKLVQCCFSISGIHTTNPERRLSRSSVATDKALTAVLTKSLCQGVFELSNSVKNNRKFALHNQFKEQ